MKNLILIVTTISLFWISGCESNKSDSYAPASYMSDFDPGTLGSVGTTDFNCSEIDLEAKLDDLLEINPYIIKTEDSTAVNWWMDGGYDFLTYRCINIRKRLYMITINSDAPHKSDISVRAYYDRNKKDWVVAKKFNTSDNYRAEKAMKYLSNEMSSCL